MEISIKNLSFVFISLLVFLVGIIADYSIVGYIITIGFAVYALLKPKNSLIVLFVYFPIRPFLLEFNPGLKVIGDAIIFTLLLRTLYIGRKNWKNLFHFQWFELAYLGFCFIGAISAFLTGVSLTGIILQLRAFLLFYLVYYIVKRMDITKEDITKFVWTTLVVAVLLSVHGLIEKLSLRGLLLPSTWENMPLSAQNRIRIYGLIGNPNQLAYYLSLAFILVFYLKNQVQGKAKTIAQWSLYLFSAVWFLTYSRGTWIAFIVVMILYFWFTRNMTLFKNVIVTIILGILIIAVPANIITYLVENTNFGEEQREVQKEFDQSEGGLTERLKGTFEKEEIEGSKRGGRLYIVDKGFDVFMDHPIIGTGFGTFGDSAALNVGSPIYEEYEINREFYSDNQYIQIIVQTGILGTILFAIFLLHMLYLMWKKKQQNDNQQSLTILMISILLGSFVAGVVYNQWENDAFTLYYFAILAYLLHSNKPKQGA